jgi:hypothetical protein
MISRILALLLAGPLLGGCLKTLTGSVAGGESQVFERPPYAVRGKTTYDQNWIDSQVEGGVAAFGWDRPAPRPPQLDAPQPSARKAAAPAPAAKRTIVQRIKARITCAPVAPVPYVAAPIVPAAAAAAAARRGR